MEARVMRQMVVVENQPVPRDEFEACFLRHYPRIYGILCRLTGDPGDAEDLAIETFLRLWRRAPVSLENTGGWLSRVAMRLGFNSLRSRKRRNHYEEQAAGEDWLGQLGPDPQRHAETIAQRLRVRSILKKMAQRDARILLLHHSGHSYKEIATALKLNPNSIGVMLIRAEKEFERIFRKGD